MLKVELVPAAGDKLVLKLSPPPPLADKQVCVNLQWLGEGYARARRCNARNAAPSLQDYPLAFCG